VGFSPGNQLRKYPDDPQQVDARERLLELVSNAREIREDILGRAHAADTRPDTLHPIPGSGAHQKAQGGGGKKKKRDDLPPRRSPREVKEICEKAISLKQQLDMLYVTRDDTRKLVRVAPERIAVNQQGQQVLVATDLAKNERLSYQLIQIERLAALEGPPEKSEKGRPEGRSGSGQGGG
jgi:predicted DNA-binding transcriptional regulator YafY